MPTHHRKYEKSWKDGHAYFISTSMLFNFKCNAFDWLFLITRPFVRITGNSITMKEARDYELSLLACTVNGAQRDSTSTPDENPVLSFAELKELIESGNVDKIPNNKIISEGLNVCFFFLVLEIELEYILIYLFYYRMSLQVNRLLLQEKNLGRWGHHNNKNFVQYSVRLLPHLLSNSIKHPKTRPPYYLYTSHRYSYVTSGEFCLCFLPKVPCCIMFRISTSLVVQLCPLGCAAT
jgi:hypothetical protein